MIFTVAPLTAAPVLSLSITVSESAPFLGGSGLNAVVITKPPAPADDDLDWELVSFELQPAMSSPATTTAMSAFIKLLSK